ncbi:MULTISPECIES: DUF2274 domain-containing protein [Chlorobium]|jgi:hypothetical protein|uniref:DUF2274 domain-containing protein n=1 Tax=Chlorobium phaeovibrioides TaxID=1094 RepID=A0A5M8I7U9_CHLPH|nr:MULTISPECIES: DUF2274 domain-containing protein [Chlorobium]KAA6230462.1 DUF2274 domain-containing protein [Chlorobium phaeovibrioides]MDT9547298.1 DUF2274 domain-containing protein [Chlorobium phaeovibrioides]TCD46898.1 DUF2274 domain-containing protein [Chlorobium sp. N1]
MQTLNIDIKAQQEPVKKSFILPKETADALDLYVQLAQKEFPGVTETDVVTAMLTAHMKKDKFFQAQQKKRIAYHGRKPQRSAATGGMHEESREVA